MFKNSKSYYLTKILCIVVCCVVGIILFLKGEAIAQKYEERKNLMVTVEATICKINESKDSDGDKEYRTYIEYTYNGITYSDVYWKYSSQRSMAGEIGDKLEITIYSDAPETFPKNTYIKSSLSYILAMICFGFAIRFLFLGNSERYAWYMKNCGINHENIKKDLFFSKKEERKKSLWKILFGIGLLFFMVSKDLYDITILMVFGLALIMLFWGVIGLDKANKELKKIQEDKFSIVSKIVVEKYEKSDGDGGGEYYIIYLRENMKETYRLYSQRLWKKLEINDEVRFVYIEDNTKPIYCVLKNNEIY